MAEQEMERIYTIPLRKAKHGSRNKMANRAVRVVRDYLGKHMKSDDVWLDAAVNEAIWARGMYKVPSKIRVRAVRFEDGVVEVSLPEEEASASIRAQLKEERESKAPIMPQPSAEELEGIAAEDEETETAEIEAEPEETEAGEIEAEPEPKEAKPVSKDSAPESEAKEAAADEAGDRQKSED